MKNSCTILLALGIWLAPSLLAQGPAATLGQRMLDDYFNQRTAELRAKCLTPYRTREAWQQARPQLQEQLREMLGLNPWPERTPLKPVITNRIEQEDIQVETLHFQSRPGLYITANLYLPRSIDGPLPTVLYVCGHAIVKEGDRSFGNKVAYQHHGIWFAQNGYACLVIDTIHRGEIEGIHHGTYSYDMWWWNSRGYSSAGLEAWNSIRALDYLATRPEVDMNRIGITGRSGGGVYSWWTAAIDERVKVAVPVAGITDLQNHVIDGTVEGHCDCMFMVNTYRWDYAQVAALLAPRPLLIANTDKDSIFPLDGVVRLHRQVRDIYGLYDAEDQLGLLITEGPHKDTQDLRVPTFRWFNRFLKGTTDPITQAAEKRFSNQALAAFKTFPPDAINKTIQETFVPSAPPIPKPQDRKQWDRFKKNKLQRLREKSFRSWPTSERTPATRSNLSQEIPGGILEHHSLTVQPRVYLPLYLYLPDSLGPETETVLWILDESNGTAFHNAFQQAASQGQIPPLGDHYAETAIHAWFAPRGIGPTAWDQSKRHQTQVRRRFMLLGETLDSMRVFDIVRAVQALRELLGLKDSPLTLAAAGTMGVNTLYASLFSPNITRLDLTGLPRNHREGPDYLNVSRIWHLPTAFAVSLERHSITLRHPQDGLVSYAQAIHNDLKWKTTLTIQQESTTP